MLAILTFVPAKRRTSVAIIILSVVWIGVIDYFTGPWVSLLVFYLAPISLAAAWLGLSAALVTAVGSVGVRLWGDYDLGAPYAHHPTVVWNSVIVLSTYMFVAFVLRRLILLQRELEARVRARTAALAQEVSVREQLQRELIEISERERRTIGNDLHDGLGQHLTAMAYAAQILSQQLAGRADDSAQAARAIVRLAEEGILQSRQLARGLLLTAIEPEDLAREMEELAATVQRQNRVHCVFELRGDTLAKDSNTASNLFRIAEEAVRNSVRHARPTELRLSLITDNDGMILDIQDNGPGLPADIEPKPGVGLRVMAHRAKLIGGELSVESSKERGTRIYCRVPLGQPSASVVLI